MRRHLVLALLATLPLAACHQGPDADVAEAQAEQVAADEAAARKAADAAARKQAREAELAAFYAGDEGGEDAAPVEDDGEPAFEADNGAERFTPQPIPQPARNYAPPPQNSTPHLRYPEIPPHPVE